MEKFTASEVRESAIAVAARDMEYEAEMLHAFADMLEAQERAVPVAIVKDSDALYTGFLSWTDESVPPETKLYTHPPSPSDAERLAYASLERFGRTRRALRPSQPPAASVPDAMVERACKRYAFREDGATFPDAYSDEEVLAERTLMREFLEHVLLAEQENPNG